MVSKSFDFELEKAKAEIEKTKAKTVIVQIPTGLRPEATKIYDELKKPEIKLYIWAGSCFGYCDQPNVRNADLLIQFGHNVFKSAEKHTTQ